MSGLVINPRNQIIMYHGVVENSIGRFNGRHLDLQIFEKQIAFLSRHCNIISLEDYFEGKFDPKKSNFAITFDDGYLNNYQFAKPILEKYNVEATYFITGLKMTSEEMLWADLLDIATHFELKELVLNDISFKINEHKKLQNINGMILHDYIKQVDSSFETKVEMSKVLSPYIEKIKQAKIRDYWQLMNNDHIIETSKSDVITIGSHGYYHNNLGNIEFSHSARELKKSKEYLENLIQKEINSLGYPDGSYTRETIQYAESIGFKYQVATESYLFDDDEQDPRIINRKGIYPVGSWGNQITY